MIKDDKSGIYCIENTVNKKKYIGQSKHVKERWYKHKNELNNNMHYNDYLQNSWNKYGADNFSFYVLEYCPEDLLDEKEIYYIELYDTMCRDSGYNLKSGGQKTSNSYSEETRKKLSDSIKKSYSVPGRKELQRINAINQWKDPEIKKKICGKNNSMYGKHHTEEAKRKIGEARKGKPGPRRNRTPVFCEELNKEFMDATTAGKELNLDSSAILKVCQGKRNTCGGYHWKFIMLENKAS